MCTRIEAKQIYLFSYFQAQRKWEADEEEHKRKKRDYEISMIEMEQVLVKLLKILFLRDQKIPAAWLLPKCVRVYNCLRAEREVKKFSFIFHQKYLGVTILSKYRTESASGADK